MIHHPFIPTNNNTIASSVVHQCRLTLAIYQFFKNDFFCLLADAIHSSYPFHRTTLPYVKCPFDELLYLFTGSIGNVEKTKQNNNSLTTTEKAAGWPCQMLESLCIIEKSRTLPRKRPILIEQ